MDNSNQPLLSTRIGRIIDDHCCAFTDSETEPRAYAFIRRIRPVAQNGPQCGLVALHMAADILPSPVSENSVEPIYEMAKQSGFTNHGEIFSVKWLAILATELYPSIDAEVIEIDPIRSIGSFIIRSLLESKCLLVPYDADKNHEPCLNNGHTAHWALVIGFLIIDFSTELVDCCNCTSVISDTSRRNFYWLSRPETARACDSGQCALSGLISRASDKNIYIFVLHGKSKHAAVWSLNKLLDSNRNLREIGPKRLNDGLHYVLPDDGVAGGLCGKLLLLG